VAKNKISVDEFMAASGHPFKAEVQAVREIMLGVNEGITEEVKWNAPSFSYKGYMVTFNLWERNRIHLVWHNAAIMQDEFGLLEGDYKDRRMMYFADMADVEAKRPALEGYVRQWIVLMDAQQ
jgi:hypothetical protein